MKNNLHLNNIYENLKGSILAVYKDKFEVNINNLIIFKQSLLEVMTFFKLHSLFNFNTAIDLTVIDNLTHKYRFTLVYTIQSTITNNNFYIITKLNEGAYILSLQNIFPAFNLA
jgi:NADH:ubiquinone oxidoreductase subunit C